jgi:hypothetical protein
MEKGNWAAWTQLLGDLESLVPFKSKSKEMEIDLYSGLKSIAMAFFFSLDDQRKIHTVVTVDSIKNYRYLYSFCRDFVYGKLVISTAIF